MTLDKSLAGGQEKIVRTVERTLAAQARREQPGVKITNLASGKVQVEVHAYDDDVSVAGDRARAEFDRQMATTSVPTQELDELRWLASIGQAMQQRQADLEEAVALEDAGGTLVNDTTVVNVEVNARKRPSVSVEGPTDTDDLLAKLHEINAKGVEESDA
jgi:hypothetical protein